jgi:hypothetical protein
MSAAAPSNPRSDYNYSEVLETMKTYNTLTENQGLLTSAEMRLAMIIVRRGGHREGVQVSDRNWREWARLDPKSKELAMRGLQKKGFHIEGRGENTRFRLNAHDWKQYCRTADRSVRPHVEQKRAPAKPGQMIHPECRKSGCYMARQAEGSNLISIADATPNRKPVSDFANLSPT